MTDLSVWDGLTQLAHGRCQYGYVEFQGDNCMGQLSYGNQDHFSEQLACLKEGESFAALSLDFSEGVWGRCTYAHITSGLVNLVNRQRVPMHIMEEGPHDISAESCS